MAFRMIPKPIVALLENEKTGGVLLLLCTVLSILGANSAVSGAFIGVWLGELNLSFGVFELDLSLREWVNDGLMALFFLMVGLQIQREFYMGQLADPRGALLPIIAALGGMAVPALIHFAFNHGTEFQPGMGIPVATDIAFSLGILALLGDRVPFSAKIFLTALAIIDDLGAVVVIALFYSQEIMVAQVLVALCVFLVLLVFKRLGVRPLAVYLGGGLVMWYLLLHSGVHATIAGVLLAFAIPFSFNDRLNPSLKLQRALRWPVAYLVLPVFAAANTVIVIDPESFGSLVNGNGLGIALGLWFGKPIGIFLFSWALVALKFCRLPTQMEWKHLATIGALGGIGFTMSIFIAQLAFADPLGVQRSVLAILAGSVLSALTGYAAALLLLRKTAEQTFEGARTVPLASAFHISHASSARARGRKGEHMTPKNYGGRHRSGRRPRGFGASTRS